MSRKNECWLKQLACTRTRKCSSMLTLAKRTQLGNTSLILRFMGSGAVMMNCLIAYITVKPEAFDGTEMKWM